MRRRDFMKLGAALAYYTVLALAPLLIVVIAVIGFVLGAEAATSVIHDGQVLEVDGTAGTISVIGAVWPTLE